MSGASVAAKIKKGLGKVTKALGSGELIYLVQKTVSGGGSPTNPATVTTENVLLEDAVLKTIVINQFSNSSAIDGDKELVTSSDIELKVGDKIIQGSTTMIVKVATVYKPSGVLLAQKCIARDQ